MWRTRRTESTNLAKKVERFAMNDIGSVALCIGANAAIFHVVNSVLLRPSAITTRR